MLEENREMENSLREVTRCVAQTAGVLAASGSMAPETYLAAIQSIRALRETWRHHLEIERVLFARMVSRNRISADFLERITANNQVIKDQLEGIMTAPWPRSSHAGLQSLRTGVGKILTHLRAQIEREHALILATAHARAGTEMSELVAS